MTRGAVLLQSSLETEYACFHGLCFLTLTELKLTEQNGVVAPDIPPHTVPQHLLTPPSMHLSCPLAGPVSWHKCSMGLFRATTAEVGNQKGPNQGSIQ